MALIDKLNRRRDATMDDIERDLYRDELEALLEMVNHLGLTGSYVEQPYTDTRTTKKTARVILGVLSTDEHLGTLEGLDFYQAHELVTLLDELPAIIQQAMKNAAN